MGSTPAKAGAKAIIDFNGAIQGTVGGGAAEAAAQMSAVEAMRVGRPRVLDFRLEGSALGDSDPLCGGRMLMLIDPTAAGHRAAYEAAWAARQRRERGVLLTVIQGENQPGVEVRFLAERAIPSEIGFPGVENISSVVSREESELFVRESPQERENLKVLAEPLIPSPMLLIVGGGHIGQALAVQADLVGFEITVIDDRAEFTAAGLFPEGVTTRCARIDEEIERFPIGSDTYIVIVTRGHQHDAEALAACLHKPAAYIGMIGSRRKVALMRQEFIESGRATAGEFDRVYAPIGLDIGSVTVPEIAASITAQLIAVRRKERAPRAGRPANEVSMICAMILAAGRSQRMGTQKLLLPLGDRPVIARVVDEVLRSPVDRVFVVVGPDGGGIVEALAGRRVEFVKNPNAESEMLSSVRCGLSAMPEDCVAVLVVLGDQPGVTVEVISTLVKAFRTRQCGIVAPSYNGRRGHPLLLAMRYREEILNQYQDVGLRRTT